MMIDVGQGDAFLIKSPGGKIILVDAGQADQIFDRGERTILPLLDELNIDQIDYAFISHLDLDHYGGIISLIHKGRIGHLLKAPPDKTEADGKLEKFLKDRGQSFSYYYKGIMKVDELRIYILNDGNISLMGNDGSGVLRMLYGNISILFTGDIHQAGERYYINSYGKFLSSDVLKVSHHGSKSSTSGEFIKFVNPDFALISAGYKNRFGHPSEEVLTRLTSAGCRIYRTDLNRAVLLRSDGYEIRQVSWYK
jgi:competence protein ComEC